MDDNTKTYDEPSKSPKDTRSYEETKSDLVAAIVADFGQLQSEVSERNAEISKRDGYVYGDRLERSIDVPFGHDFTPVNWLRRTVEIHKNMFMSRGFQISSTYDSQEATDSQEQGRVSLENNKNKEFAEQRVNLINSIIKDNGGMVLWSTMAENGSAIGDSCIKVFYNEDEDKVEISYIESIENLYALWSKDDFRTVDAYAYVYQVSKQEAIRDYGASEDVVTSPLGAPLNMQTESSNTQPVNGAPRSNSPNPTSAQPMVTIMEVTGKIEGWGSVKGKCKEVSVGKENALNLMIVGSNITRLIDDPKKIPKYYILPNKRQRRRPWGMSDISDAAIYINQTYIETLSDWRTAASKINFNKYKAFGFGPDVQLPKPEPREIEYLPLSDGQDIVELSQTQVDGIDWNRQLDELKEQYVRETGISRVLFDDPSVTFNSNQALLTSMKPTSDIAEAKKQLWEPILIDIFTDALELVGLHKPELKEITSPDDNWTLKVMWPSVMQKEDPVYQSMLLNRFNAGTMSLQSYLEAQGENKEEVDRLKDEMDDPVTAAILGKQLPLYAQSIINYATAQIQAAYQATLPQPEQSQGPTQGGGINPNGGAAATVTPDNQATGGVGLSPVSQPGSGATASSAGGALAQTVQNTGG